MIMILFVFLSLLCKWTLACLADTCNECVTQNGCEWLRDLGGVDQEPIEYYSSGSCVGDHYRTSESGLKQQWEVATNLTDCAKNNGRIDKYYCPIVKCGRKEGETCGLIVQPKNYFEQAEQAYCAADLYCDYDKKFLSSTGFLRQISGVCRSLKVDVSTISCVHRNDCRDLTRGVGHMFVSCNKKTNKCFVQDEVVGLACEPRTIASKLDFIPFVTDATVCTGYGLVCDETAASCRYAQLGELCGRGDDEGEEYVRCDGSKGLACDVLGNKRCKKLEDIGKTSFTVKGASAKFATDCADGFYYDFSANQCIQSTHSDLCTDRHTSERASFADGLSTAYCHDDGKARPLYVRVTPVGCEQAAADLQACYDDNSFCAESRVSDFQCPPCLDLQYAVERCTRKVFGFECANTDRPIWDVVFANTKNFKSPAGKLLHEVASKKLNRRANVAAKTFCKDDSSSASSSMTAVESATTAVVSASANGLAFDVSLALIIVMVLI